MEHGDQNAPPLRADTRFRVTGRVQGVGFRWFVVQTARQCDVEGDVRNLRDGSVEVRARGTEAALDRLLAALRTGPPASRVEQVETLAAEDDWQFVGFDVRP